MLFKLGLLCIAATAALAHVPLDPVCSKGFYSGVQTSDFQFDKPFDGFYQVTKDFFSITWYGGAPATYTSGTDNTPGAIRGGPYGNGAFKDLLVAYYTDKTTSLFQKFISLVQNKATVPAHPNEELIMDSYTDHFAFDSICEGRATALHMMVVFCANDPVAVADDFIRQTAAQTLTQETHSNTFVGNCPQFY